MPPLPAPVKIAWDWNFLADCCLQWFCQKWRYVVCLALPCPQLKSWAGSPPFRPLKHPQHFKIKELSVKQHSYSTVLGVGIHKHCTHIHILVQSLAPVACIGRTGNSGIFFQSKQHWSGILTPQHSSVTSCGQHEPKELWKLRIEAWVPSQGFIRVGVEHQDTKSTGLKTTD